MRVAFCAYRDWAIQVLPTIKKHPNVSHVVHISKNETLEMYLGTMQPVAISGVYVEPKPLVDIVLFCGWSTPPSQRMVDSNVPMFSEHPATSDRYSPGTPLQNQILDGLIRTQHRIVKVGFPELSPRQWSHEVTMDLSGNMDDILEQMSATSKVLFTRFLDDYPEHITWKTWPELDPELQVPRRTPDMSKIDRTELMSLTTRQIYDRIRCLEAPYPNAYMEDEHGTVYFERVSYKTKR